MYRNTITFVIKLRTIILMCVDKKTYEKSLK